MAGVEGAGFDLRPGMARTSAPCGQTPVLRWPSTRAQVSVRRGSTRGGRLDTRVRDGALDRLDSVIVLRHVRPPGADQGVVSWEGSPRHTGAVRTVWAEGGARQRPVAQRPPYAPDLNPGAGGWPHRKQGARRQLCRRDLAPLRRERAFAMQRLRRKPRVMTACAAEAG